MCIDIIKNPVAAIMNAKKRNDAGRTLQVILETSFFSGLGFAFLLGKFFGMTAMMFTLAVVMFLTVIVFILFKGLLLQVIATNMGGKGNYFDSLNVVSYSLLTPSLAFLVASIISWLPVFGNAMGVIILAVAIASGFSMIYRGTKEVYKVDMMTTFVIVTVLVVSLFATLWIASVFNGLNFLQFSRFGGF